MTNPLSKAMVCHNFVDVVTVIVVVVGDRNVAHTVTVGNSVA